MPIVQEPIQFSGGLIIVKAIIYGPIKEQIVRLGLDTGASKTHISPAYLEAVGYDVKKYPVLSVATGALKSSGEKGYDVPVDGFEFMGKRLKRLSVLARPMPMAFYNLDGLLGNDFLRISRTAVTLDFGKQMISLSY